MEPMIARAPQAPGRSMIGETKSRARRREAGRGVGRAQWGDDPPPAGARGCQPEIVFREKLPELSEVKILSGTEKNFDSIKPQRGGLLAAGGEIIPEHKRTASGFRDERDG